MLLLINDFRATFHPYGATPEAFLFYDLFYYYKLINCLFTTIAEREVVETAMHAVDYSQVSATLSTQESGYGYTPPPTYIYSTRLQHEQINNK
jgi:hypothetical protein